MLQGESPTPSSSQSGISSISKWVAAAPDDISQTTCRRQAYVDPSGSCSTSVDPSGPCSSCRRPPGAKHTSTQVGPAHPESTQVGPARPAGDLQTTSRRQAYVDPSGSCSSRVDPSGSCSCCRRQAYVPKWVLLIQSRPKWVLLVLQTPSLRRPKWVLLIQSRPKWVLLVQSSTLLSLVHLGDGPLTRLNVPRITHLARGVIPLSARDVGSLAIPLKTRTHRLRIANNGTINRTKRIIFVLPRWIF